MEKQIRVTKQKELISNQIKKIDSFFSAKELHQKLKMKNIGIATIYRYLKTATKNKKLFSYTCNNKKIYSKKEKSHCHFKCEKTGKTTHFEIETNKFFKNKIPGTVKSFQLEITGICEKCRK